MSMKPTKVQFNGGELSPWLEGRTDIAKYDKTAKLCRNFIPLAEGSLKRRGGTRFVETAPLGEDVIFQIEAYPEEAVVLINNEPQNKISVNRGDKISFEVRANGYASQSGEVVIAESVTMTVKLISRVVRSKLEIEPVPEDAVVKIAGLKRLTYQAYQNEDVPYMVYKNGYEAQSGTVFMDTDKTLTVTLEESPVVSGSYGDWGIPEYFVACTAVGRADEQLKCFCIRFTNGYLTILFEAHKKVPDENAQWLFFRLGGKNYDSVAYKSGTYYLTTLTCMSKAYYYYGASELVAAFDKGLTMVVCGWQLDEDGKYASYYTRYDGTVSGTVVKIFYEGQNVWTMKERKND